MVIALQGAAMISMEGSFTSNPLLSGSNSTNRSEVVSDDNGNAFNNDTDDELYIAWKSALSDESFIEYVRSRLPVSLDETDDFDRNKVKFSDNIESFNGFLYDSITAVGISMCQAGENEIFFTGEQVYDHFRNLSFIGTSGNVQIDPRTGTRNSSSVSFVVWNTVLNDTSMEFVPAYIYTNKAWRIIPGNSFHFADGTESPPNSLPLPNMDYNYIGKSERIVGFGMMTISVTSSIICLLWLMYYRKESLVVSSQPLFLGLVSIGTLFMSLTILPFSIDDSTERSQQHLNQACMAVPWLYILGISMASSAIVAKIRGVYKVGAIF
jgi:hypothetical protein